MKLFDKDSIILVNDGNRGLVYNEVIFDVLFTYYEFGNSVAVIHCTEVVYNIEEGLTWTIKILKK